MKKRQPKSTRGAYFLGERPQKLPSIGVAGKHEWRLPEKTPVKQAWRIPDDIDVPMFDPIIIPNGYSQSFSVEKNHWYLAPDNLR